MVCAEDEEEAHRLAASSKMAMKLLRRGQLIPVPPVEKALRFLESDGDGTAAPHAPGGRRRAVIGTPDKVRAELEALAGDYGADEVIVVTITFDHEARRRSYELLADAFDLRGRTGTDASAAAS